MDPEINPPPFGHLCAKIVNYLTVLVDTKTIIPLFTSPLSSYSSVNNYREKFSQALRQTLRLNSYNKCN